MKDLIFSISILVMAVAFIPCHAQETKALEIGVRGGVNFASLYTKDASKSDIIPGFNGGFFAKIPVSTLFAFQPELSVSTKGATITYNSLLLDGTANFNLTYLEMPLLCVVNVTKRANVQVGPYVAYLLDSKVKNKSNVNLFNFEQNLDADSYNRIDAGIVLGAGIDIDAITMGIRYNLGLTKVGKTQSFLGTNYIIPNSNNGVISFYLAVSLL
jgi:hypothetical protein